MEAKGTNPTRLAGVTPLSNWPLFPGFFDMLEAQGVESLLMLQGGAIIQPIGLPAGFSYMAKFDECRGIVVGGRIIGAEWMTNVQELQPACGFEVLPTTAEEPRPVMYA